LSAKLFAATGRKRSDMPRRLTLADALSSWRVDGELRGGHRPSETLAFVSALQDLADAQRERFLPDGVISPDCEPRWLGRLRRLFGR
jgi:hypothetical protein